jgi:Fe2+ transport system protein FeoA
MHRSLLQVATAQDELNTLSASVSSLIDPLSTCDDVGLSTSTDSLRNQIKRHETLMNDALKQLQYEVVRFNGDDELRVKLSALGITINKKVCMCMCVSHAHSPLANENNNPPLLLLLLLLQI